MSTWSARSRALRTAACDALHVRTGWSTVTKRLRRPTVGAVGAVLGAALLVASVPAVAPPAAPFLARGAVLPVAELRVIGISYPGGPAAGEGPAAPAVSAPLVLPPPVTAAAPGAVGALGVPDVAVAAYQSAADRMARDQPGCRVSWTLIAGIGRVESGHARGGRVDATGRTVPLILGPVLDGSLAGNAAIRDTDGGRLDQDTVWDRAVGPMQFLPGTWARWGADANGDGTADPHNIADAALGTARYLCSGGGDLSQDAGARAAVFRYNHSNAYVDTVLAWAQAYATGATTIPALPPGPVTPATTTGPAPATTTGPAPTPSAVTPSEVSTPPPSDPPPSDPPPATDTPTSAPEPVVSTEPTVEPLPSVEPTSTDALPVP